MNTKTISQILLMATTLVVSGICSAGHYSSHKFAFPDEWFFGVELSHLASVNNDLHFAEQTTGYQNNGATVRERHVHVLDPNHDLGFTVEGGVHLNKTHDFTVNWTHHETDRDTRVAGGTFNADGWLEERFGGGDDDDDKTTTVDGHVDFETNIVNFEFGHTSGYGRHTTYRFHGGVQIADLENHFNMDKIDLEEVFVEAENARLGASNHSSERDYYALTSEFTGVGPRFGADGEYYLGDNFTLVGKAAAALLIGDLDTQVHEKEFESNVSSANALGVHDLRLDDTSSNHMSETVLVPEFEGRLGIRYDHKTGQGLLSFESGYRVTDFADAVKWLGGSISDNNPWPSNHGLHGFYLSGRFTHA